MEIVRALLIGFVPIAIFAAAALLARACRNVFRRWRMTFGFWLLVGALSIKTCLLLSPAELIPQPVNEFVDALIFFAASLLIAALLITLIFDYLLTRYRSFEIPNLIRQIVVFVVSFVLLAIFLKTVFAFDLTPIIATSAVLSMVLGLALQDLLKNLFAGLTLSMDRTCEIGDWIRVGDDEGKVVELNWRTIKLRTRENTTLIIPNANLSSTQIFNYSSPQPEHILTAKIGIDYRTPPNMVRRVLEDALTQVSGVLSEPPIEVLQKGFGDSALLFELRLPIDDRANIHRIISDINFAVWYACKRENITIPFPIRTVEFYNMRRMPTEHLVSDKRALHAVDFFRELPEKEVEAILNTGHNRVFGEGEFICRKGDPADTLFIILAGQVDIIAPLSSKRLVRLETGAVFGEMGLMDGGMRKADVLAHSDVMLLAIPGPDFVLMLDQNPAVANWFQTLLLERQHKLETEDKLKSMVTQNEDDAPGTFLDRVRNLFRF